MIKYIVREDGNMSYRVIAKTEEDTIVLAQNLESEKFPNMVVCLYGDLSSGKTLFVKGFAHALEVEDDVTSPTFNIIKEYSGQLPLFHMDVYRCGTHVECLGLEEYYTKDGVVMIEWADLIEDQLPKERLDIHFEVLDNDTRVITLKPKGTKYEDACEGVI
jgi:tRNA threonylcarbamoyladenosine biosynthesis protein TsaE